MCPVNKKLRASWNTESSWNMQLQPEILPEIQTWIQFSESKEAWKHPLFFIVRLLWLGSSACECLVVDFTMNSHYKRKDNIAYIISQWLFDVIWLVSIPIVSMQERYKRKIRAFCRFSDHLARRRRVVIVRNCAIVFSVSCLIRYIFLYFWFRNAPRKS